MRKKVTSFFKSHKLRTMVALFVVLSFAFMMLFFYWSMRPVARLRFTHLLDSYTLPLKYRSIKVQPPDKTKKAQEVPVLLYHGILAGDNDGFSISKNTFNNQMVQLKKQGYSTITMRQYVDFLNGRLDLPEKSILISFDDGRKDSYFRSDAVLKALDFKATMFLATGYSLVDGSNYYLDKSEVTKMHLTGRWDVESHSDYAGTNQIKVDQHGKMMNFYGNLKWLDAEGRSENLQEYKARVTTEMQLVKTRLNQHLGRNSAKVLSFPFGDYAQANSNPQLTKILLTEAEKLYEQVFIQFRKGEPYSSNYKGKDVFMSRRIEVDPNLSGLDLTKLLSGSTAKPLPYTAGFSKNEGWVSDWGSLKLEENNGIIIAASGKGTSGEAYLDGTRQLTSYNVQADLESVEKDTVIKLIALYIDGKNYVGCNFANDEVRIEKLAAGKRTQPAKVKYDYATSGGKRTKLGIKIDIMSKIHCFVDGLEIVSARPDNDSIGGGPAILVWNPREATAKVRITKFKLEEYN